MPVTVLAFPASSASAVETIAELRDTFLDDASARRGVNAKITANLNSTPLEGLPSQVPYLIPHQ